MFLHGRWGGEAVPLRAGDLEERNVPNQVGRLMFHGLAGAGDFLDDGGVLLGGFIHLTHRVTDLLDATALFAARRRNLRDDIAHSANAGENLSQHFTG